MYSKIVDFCKVRNLGNIYSNGNKLTPRLIFLTNLLKSEGIEYEIDAFHIEDRFSWFKSEEDYLSPEKDKDVTFGFNIIMKGSSNRMVIAHHDIANHRIDNANDNSASCINAIMVKKLRPDINVVLTDGEETGGLGSRRLAQQIVKGDFGDIEWVLNFELTGKGGKYFFIGDNPGPLVDRIKKLFDCPVVHTPYNDSVTLRKYGIDSTVINPVPPLPEGETSNMIFNDGTYLDFSIVFNCHNNKDTIASISPDDMKEFVETVVLKILY